jgi:Phasin protein
MAQNEPRSEPTEQSFPLNLMPTEFAEIGKKGIENFINAQTELFDNVQELNREWLRRIQSEANLTSEFASKLTTARTPPDAMTVCQEWSRRRLELMAEDGKHLLTDTQKLMEAGARMLAAGGWPSGRKGLGGA